MEILRMTDNIKSIDFKLSRNFPRAVDHNPTRVARIFSEYPDKQIALGLDEKFMRFDISLNKQFYRASMYPLYFTNKVET